MFFLFPQVFCSFSLHVRKLLINFTFLIYCSKKTRYRKEGTCVEFGFRSKISIPFTRKVNQKKKKNTVEKLIDLKYT